MKYIKLILINTLRIFEKYLNIKVQGMHTYLSHTKVEVDRFSMANVQYAIWFRRETGSYLTTRNFKVLFQ